MDVAKRYNFLEFDVRITNINNIGISNTSYLILFCKYRQLIDI